MPQMNPMWWFSLFIMFVTILLSSNSLNYFYSKNALDINSFKKSNIKNNINWKW
uniref:ATP synthase complex subunit 8 n=1 Tax=Psococerastis albimaculata TaxID=1264641 RepID=M9P7B4_9NEOP|nr:ATP synthase F0 subunit 8 [Psococerastis albimaculata]AFY16887.1 ATP synthase F0 subunit 8 [Psococerastis albimaculata]